MVSSIISLGHTRAEEDIGVLRPWSSGKRKSKRWKDRWPPSKSVLPAQTRLTSHGAPRSRARPLVLSAARRASEHVRGCLPYCQVQEGKKLEENYQPAGTSAARTVHSTTPRHCAVIAGDRTASARRLDGLA